MAVNLNTVWATVAGVFVFGGRLGPHHLAGVGLSLGGNYLCTSAPPSSKPAAAESGEGQTKERVEDHMREHRDAVAADAAGQGLAAHLAAHEAKLTPPTPAPAQGGALEQASLAKWLVPALASSVLITSVEMSARALADRYEASASLFAQAQMAMSGLIALLKLVLRKLRGQAPKTADGQSGGSGVRRWCPIPLYAVIFLAIVRNYSQVWMALCIQRGPNPGLPKTVSGGVNTVLATLVGVLCFGSRLSASNVLGIAAATVGTYLCVRP